MEDKIKEMKLDVAELETLLKQAKRMKINDFLSIEIRKRQTEIIELEEKAKAAPTTPKPTPASTPKTYEVKLNNYAWDQSSKFVKFYVTVKNVHKIENQESVSCKFTPKSLEMNIKDLDGKNYVFIINNLLYKINPETSTWKIKTDMVLINAAKEDATTTWSHVTELEKRASDAKKPAIDKEANAENPGASLMNLMKKMYEQGDDEMKRTIAKAWTEGQEKGNNFGM